MHMLEIRSLEVLDWSSLLGILDDIFPHYFNF